MLHKRRRIAVFNAAPFKAIYTYTVKAFDRLLYAPLTLLLITCRLRSVQFKRKVDMKRRPMLWGMLSAGGVVQLALILCSVPFAVAQSGLDIANADPSDPLGVTKPEFGSFNQPIKEADRSSAGRSRPGGNVHGVDSATGAGPADSQHAGEVILLADVDVERFTPSNSGMASCDFQKAQTRPLPDRRKG